MSHPENLKEGNPFKDKVLLISFSGTLVLALIKIVLIFQASLLSDEANYVIWARHLPFGFYDHGAGIAYFIKPFLLVFGENSVGARAAGFLWMGALSFFLYRFFKKYASPQAGLIAVILLNSLPVFQGLSVLNTPDTPLMISLMFSMMLFYKALHHDKKYFYAAGFFIGFALLSKVSAAFVILPLGVLLLAGLKEGKYLKELSIAVIIGVAVYMPFVIYWFQTDFAPFQFMISRTGGKSNLKIMLEFWLAQFALLSPFFFIAFLFCIFSAPFKAFRKDKTAFFGILSLFPFLIFFYFSSVKFLEANWGMAMYAGGFFSVCFFLGKHWNKIWVKLLFALNIIFCFAVSGAFIGQYFWQSFLKENDPTDRFFSFDVFKGDFKKYYEEQMDKNIPICAFDYSIPSIVNVYVKPQKEALALYHPFGFKTSYFFWQDEAGMLGENFYYISPWMDRSGVEDRFETVSFITNFISYRNGRPVHGFGLYYGKNFKGPM